MTYLRIGLARYRQHTTRTTRSSLICAFRVLNLKTDRSNFVAQLAKSVEVKSVLKGNVRAEAVRQESCRVAFGPGPHAVGNLMPAVFGVFGSSV